MGHFVALGEIFVEFAQRYFRVRFTHFQRMSEIRSGADRQFKRFFQ
jgi:hypothetical protein